MEKLHYAILYPVQKIMLNTVSPVTIFIKFTYSIIILFCLPAPRQSRPCLCLAWNELEPHLLAIGHDRNRSDHCITVWDTTLGAPTKESSILHLVGLSETAHSLCWDKQHRILIAGMSHKYLKMLDLRRKFF